MKTLSSSLIILSLIFIPTFLSAQKSEGEIVLSGNLAISFAQSAITLVENSANVEEDAYDITTSNTPAFQGNFDFGITSHFSMGIAFSYQKISIDCQTNDPALYQDFGMELQRLNIGVKPLFHYGGTESSKLDMFSGLRLGYKMNTVELTGNSDFDSSDFETVVPISFQLVIWGMRYFVNDNIGFNMELAVGQPHYLSGGLSIRL